MSKHNKGQVIVPTGGGKTICMIQDAIEQFKSDRLKTIVVVAPRILLANQLCEDGILEANIPWRLLRCPGGPLVLQMICSKVNFALWIESC